MQEKLENWFAIVFANIFFHITSWNYKSDKKKLDVWKFKFISRVGQFVKSPNFC